MMSLTQQLLHALHPLLTGTPATLLVAYSGGVDSHALLHCLTRLREQLSGWQLAAVHVHHGLSTHADAWQQHCQSHCDQWKVPLQTVYVDVTQASELGVEAAARKVRYQALLNACGSQDILLLGQHGDDQLETLLLQIKRGAGPKGLASMPQVKLSERGIHIVRPWLHSSRAQIEEYAASHGLNYVTDDSNSDNRFDRNFLRNQVIPLLTERWPSILQTAARSAALCAEQQSLLDEVSNDKLAVCADEHQRLSLSALQALSPQWQRQVLRLWLQNCGAELPSVAQLTQIEQLGQSRQDANPEVNLGHKRVRRFDGHLYCIDESQVCLDPLSPDAKGVLTLPSGLGVKFENVLSDCSDALLLPGQVEGVQIRFNQPLAQRFKPHTEVHSKALKQWYKQWKIPPWQRAQIPLIYCADSLVGLIVDHRILVDQYALESIDSRMTISLTNVMQ